MGQVAKTTSVECIESNKEQKYTKLHRGSKRSQIPENIGKTTFYWQEQGRHASNFQQVGFERGAQEREHAARDVVHAVLAQTTEMCGAEKNESSRQSSTANLDIKLRC